ncbi:general odorant-binding protein 67-like [Sabethes cyaneus]|uniref:general odorant-binding protein 67-like n=1 Tax=Sabethes cyaneus TaxID=53552 RepID=UPI00237D99C3|nr:general odorant-binding protein 67-like [Sabethes cyaneus]
MFSCFVDALLMCILGLIIFTVHPSQAGDVFDDTSITGASKETCYNHEEFPNPNECCTRPQWVNRYMLRTRRFFTSEVDNYREDKSSCTAKGGMYKIVVTLVDDRVNDVRLFKPRQLGNGENPQWEKMIVDVLKLCKNKITAVIGRQIGDDDTKQMCQLQSDIFEDCLNGQMFLRCPSNSWYESEGCGMAKAHLMQGCPYKSLADVVSIMETASDDTSTQDDDDDFESMENLQQVSTISSGYY